MDEMEITEEQRDAAEALLALMDEASDYLRVLCRGRNPNLQHLEAYHRGAFSDADHGGETYNNLYEAVRDIADGSAE